MLFGLNDFGLRQVNDDAKVLTRRQLFGPAYNVGFRFIVEIALGEGRRVQRIEKLDEFSCSDLNGG